MTSFSGKEEFLNIQRKRPRTAFSQDQVRSLENEFARNKYLTVGRRVELSKELGLTENQVTLGFWPLRTVVSVRGRTYSDVHKSAH